MTKVLVLGAQGMLGSMVAGVLARRPELDVSTTARHDGSRDHGFDVRSDSLEALLDSDSYEWVVNAIGVIKPRIDERDAGSIATAVDVNALFPYRLAGASAERGQRVIQIATDCVFSGTRSAYEESDAHDPLDVYGKTKSLGEVPADNVVHLRCSIIGPELGSPSSLLGWILSAEAGGELPGFTNHRWNGVTTLQFAKLCGAVIGGTEVPLTQHVVPGDAVSKAELLELVLSAYGRGDVSVRPGPAAQPVDRTLGTGDPAANARLWSAAGYETPPTIAAMLDELAAFDARQANQAA